MRFPDHRYASAADYVRDYFARLSDALVHVDYEQVGKAATLLLDAFSVGKVPYVCGNGGAAAIANHAVCDLAKGVQAGTDLKPRVISLSSNIEILTAIANDIDYADVFVQQLRTMAEAGDVLMTISASGNSENVVRALTWFRDNGVARIALTGFSGGRSAKLATVNVHVSIENYGIVEDAHQAIMQSIAQWIRQSRMDPVQIPDTRF